MITYWWHEQSKSPIMGLTRAEAKAHADAGCLPLTRKEYFTKGGYDVRKAPSKAKAH